MFKKVLLFLFSNILAPIITGFLLPIIISLKSKIQTGYWLKLISEIPRVVWIIFVIIIIIWLIIVTVVKRIRLIRDLNDQSFSGFYVVPAYGWITVAEYEYAGLVWNIRIPAPSPFSGYKRSDISTIRVEAQTPPRCPKCKTEIEQNHSFWGGYTWNCVACGYTKKSKDSYYKMANRLEKIAKRDVETKLEEELKKID